MLSYRHSFHAGNHADVIKHIVLMLILENLTIKEKGFYYLDTHAGVGRYRLASAEAEKTGEKIASSTKLFTAVKTIIIADFIMSLDNVLAIAAAAQQAHDDHQTLLVIFGLLVSIPFIVFGSQIVLAFLDRFPIIVWFGGALLGWIAGSMISTDAIMLEHLPQLAKYHTVACIAGAALVVAIALLLRKRRTAQGA